MTVTTTTLRALGALSAGMLALGMLASCTPAPEPTPTKTALFASDEEAFAAAEETYQAYSDAANAADYADPATFEPVYDWLTGTALGAEKKALSLYHAERLTKTGDATFDTFSPLSASSDEVVVQLCIDVSQVDLLREGGDSAVPKGRLPRVGRMVTFSPGSTRTGLRIESNHETKDDFSC
ncbi:hypothetical protein Q9R19_13545 [Microbacterium sp. ARD32]|uniref:hypothetical protein n=1 Tax=Microbacterium sp. ARD32 TaxID=2962577 RepID=UPI0028821B25|nr:hypothetical protein [Microbacterium sp. ARD32]MDT0158648.1 hypothetical protein [Microbacterium sp. ARD32]